VSLLERGLLGSIEDQLAAERVLAERKLDQLALGKARVLVAQAVLQRQRPFDGDLLQHRSRHHLVHQSHTQRPARIQLTTGQHQIERDLNAYQARQPLRTAEPGQEAELDLGQAKLRALVGAGDAGLAGQCHLEPTTQAGAVDSGHERLSRPGHSFERALTGTGELARLVGRRQAGEQLQIGAGDEAIRLTGKDHDGGDRVVTLDLVEQAGELGRERCGQRVDGLTGQIDQQKSAAIDAALETEAGCDVVHAASSTIAAPMPPAAQAVTNANWPPRRLSSRNV
jgi:hypothetical protein